MTQFPHFFLPHTVLWYCYHRANVKPQHSTCVTVCTLYPFIPFFNHCCYRLIIKYIKKTWKQWEKVWLQRLRNNKREKTKWSKNWDPRHPLHLRVRPLKLPHSSKPEGESNGKCTLNIKLMLWFWITNSIPTCLCQYVVCRW